ncbi:MAG: hypothetical protein ACOCSJ_02030 [Candidatus Natronoplasma sp.]
MIHKSIRKALIISFITALLIFSTFTVVSPATADPSLDYLEDSEDTQGPPDDRGPPDMIGGFGEEAGSFVSFDTIDEGISNYSLRKDGEDISIFDEVSIDEFGKYDEKVAGPMYFLKGNAAEFQLYDTSSRILKLDVYSLGESDRDVSFKLGDMEVDKRENNTVRISNYNYSGNLISLDIPGHAQRVDGENDKFINFTVEDRATLIFRMEIDGFPEGVRNFVRKRTGEGRLGAEFRIESREEEYNHTSIPYRDVNIKAQMRDETTLDMLVSSESLGDEGTLLLLDISSNVMDISSIGDIDLRFDGKSAELIGDLSELDETELSEAFSELNESDDPSYTLIRGEEGTHILVNVPEFSTHSITVEYINDAVNQYLGSLSYYVPAATASVGLVIFGLLYSKRDKNEEKKKDKNKNDRRISIDKHHKNYDKGEGNEKRINTSKKDKDKETRVRKD